MWGMDDTIANALVEESEAQVAEAQEFVKQLQSGFPEICRAVQTKHVVEAVLHAERTYIQELLRDGAIDQAQYDRLIRGNNASLKKVSQHPPTSALPTIADRLRHSRLLQECVGVCILGMESFDLMAILPVGALAFFFLVSGGLAASRRTFSRRCGTRYNRLSFSQECAYSHRVTWRVGSTSSLADR